MSNDPQSMAILNSAGDWVTAMPALPALGGAGVGCASLGGMPCVAAITGGAIFANWTVPLGSHEEMGQPPDFGHNPENEPNGGYQGLQSAPISGPPPVEVLPNTIVWPIHL